MAKAQTSTLPNQAKAQPMHKANIEVVPTSWRVSHPPGLAWLNRCKSNLKPLPTSILGTRRTTIWKEWKAQEDAKKRKGRSRSSHSSPVSDSRMIQYRFGIIPPHEPRKCSQTLRADQAAGQEDLAENGGRVGEGFFQRPEARKGSTGVMSFPNVWLV